MGAVFFTGVTTLWGAVAAGANEYGRCLSARNPSYNPELHVPLDPVDLIAGLKGFDFTAAVGNFLDSKGHCTDEQIGYTVALGALSGLAVGVVSLVSFRVLRFIVCCGNTGVPTKQNPRFIEKRQDTPLRPRKQEADIQEVEAKKED